MRINRYIARSGVTSRRKAEEIIKTGKVSVNGSPVTDLATEVSEKDSVSIDGKKISVARNKYYLFNKPTGYTATRSDPYARHSIFELLPEDESLFSVGRLDRDTSGLILVTNDGEFSQKIIHPTNKIEKEYIVRLLRSVNNDQIEQLLSGVELEDGPAIAKEALKTSEKEMTLIIEMGRKRVIRRMIEAVGNKAVGLQRVRIGSIELDVPVGKYRELSESEIKPYV